MHQFWVLFCISFHFNPFVGAFGSEKEIHSTCELLLTVHVSQLRLGLLRRLGGLVDEFKAVPEFGALIG